TRCHAPAEEKADGVDCTACHAAPHAKPVRTAESACARCHEFTFDGRAELVQKTASEHAASSFASVSCTACHATAKEGHTDHRFVSGHAPDWLARQVKVSAARTAS